MLDASSPARVTFLDRFGSPFQSTFRPHETLTVQTLAGMMRAVRALAPGLVVQGGDLIDNAQANELAQALQALAGGRVRPGSGPRGYYGVQLASNADPFYYRPDLDAPRHPGLLSRAAARFSSPGVGHVRVLPVLGDHDILVAGEIPPSPRTQALATGGQALWEPPPHLSVPAGSQLTVGGSPDGPPNPQALDQLLDEALAGPRTPVPADPGRRELGRPGGGRAAGRQRWCDDTRLRRAGRGRRARRRARSGSPRRRLRRARAGRSAGLAGRRSRRARGRAT